ncbi:MAG: DUF937 domain-containing protein [Alphaproteobacteria bacterium]|nr:MAG: DUF937 domain-containing protein [Alphaproteobacteria bacterium]
MGLLDVLNGMQQGPRGPSNPSAQSSGGMSPMTMAILGLLAWKAIKHMTAGQSGAPPQPAPSPAGGGASGGGLGGGGDVLKQLQQSGQGDKANSWVGTGENKPIAPGDLANALGADQINTLASQSGLSRDELLNGLSQYLPKVIDHLTPEGRLPSDSEVSTRL